MSATIHEETLTVSRSTIVGLLAAFFAAGDLAALEDDRIDPEYRGEAIGEVAVRFQTELLGAMPTDDDEWNTDPTLVELLARCAEFEAEMIDSCMQARVRSREVSASLEARDGRSAQLREYARRAREAGTQDVKLPTSAELLENLRLEMNAEVEARKADDAS